MNNILENDKKDWIFIILSPISGFLIIGLYYALNYFLNGRVIEGLGLELSYFITLIIFSLIFDVRHFFSTYSRTYLDKIYYTENKKWLNTSFLAIIFIPLIAYTVLVSGESLAFDSLLVAAFAVRITLVLGFYHLIKQNWGFMAIYKNKFKEPADGSDRWEKLSLLSGSFIPFILLAKNKLIWFPNETPFFTPKAEEALYVFDKWHQVSLACFVIALFFALIGFVIKSRPQYTFVSRNLAYYFFGIFLFIQSVLKSGFESTILFCLLAMVSLFIVSISITIYKAIQFGKFNTRKWAVFIGSLLLYNVVLMLPVDNQFLLIMGITTPHNIQYLKFVNVFNLKQYSNSNANHGIAKTLSKRLGLFLIVSIVFATIFEFFRTGARFIPDLMVEPGQAFASNTVYFLSNALVLVFISLVLHHYYLDAVIWRVRKDEKLNKNI